MLIYRPDGDIDARRVALAAPRSSWSGCRVAVLDNGKPNAALLMTRAAEALAARTGATLSLVVKKGPGGRSANAAVPCAPDIFARLLAEADVVITGAADCGSCTAYSVHDAVELERNGIPTVVVTTTRFRPVAQTLASATGMSDLRLLVVEHPIGGTDASTLTARAIDAAEQLEALFTANWNNADAEPASPCPTDLDLSSIQQLVGEDGASFEVVSFDRVAGTLHLRLIIDDAECFECVMPRAVLESVAADRLIEFGVRSVTIEDPREV